MNKKRTTKEEKFKLLLSYFKENEGVYRLKDLEQNASKAIGLAQNVIKDTLQALVDEGQVEEGKIGQQVFYWRFETKAVQDKKMALNALEEKLAERSKYLDELENKMKLIDPTDYEDTDSLIKEISELRVKLKSIQSRIEENSKASNAEDMVKELNGWTDNIFLIKSYVKKKGMDVKTLDKEFGIPRDLDYM